MRTTTEHDKNAHAAGGSDHRTPMSICRDEDCPQCGWPETYAEGTMEGGPALVGCRKCGWTAKVLKKCRGCDAQLLTSDPDLCERCDLHGLDA